MAEMEGRSRAMTFVEATELVLRGATTQRTSSACEVIASFMETWEDTIKYMEGSAEEEGDEDKYSMSCIKSVLLLFEMSRPVEYMESLEEEDK